MEKLLGLTVGQVIGGIAGIIVVLSIFIEITPIKVNPVSAFLKWLGKKINGDVISKVDDLEKKFDSLDKELNETKAMTCRVRILRFGDEIRCGQRHSQESFNQVLSDINVYTKYCNEHSEFPNEQANATIKIIRDNYEERMHKNDFL